MVLKQFVFLRSDLKSFKKGSMVAQACHAVASVLYKYRDLYDVEEYLKEEECSMHTIVLKIEETDIPEILKILNEFEIKFVSWIEQPENIVTSIATVPLNLDLNENVKKFFYQYKLY